jgi:MOSC domain-containing protein YiiM
MPGILTSIVYSPQAGSYNRQPLPLAVLVPDYGIEGDRKGGHPRRNLNILDQETLDGLVAEGYPGGPGVLGENLIVRGIRLDQHPEGTQVRIGLEAVIEVVRSREPCYKLTALDPRMPAAVVGRVGVMARVLAGGTVRVGDAVALLEDR